MTMARYTWKQRSLFVPPLLLGGILLFLAPTMKAVPPATDEATGAKVVRVITAKPMDISPTAVGYGFTRPTSEWVAQTEVEGRVVWVAKEFEAGMLIAKGTHSYASIAASTSSPSRNWRLNRMLLSSKIKHWAKRLRSPNRIIVYNNRSLLAPNA